MSTLIYTRGKKVCYTPIWGNKINITNFCVSSGLKLTWNVPVIAPRQNPTLPWTDFHFYAKWDHRSPKLQLRWSFPQICLRSVASSNQQLNFFSVLSDCFNNAPSNPYSNEAWSAYLFMKACGKLLTHWGRVTHICVSNLTIMGSDNGLSPGQCQAIIGTNAGILFIGPLGTNFSEILIEILSFSFKKMLWKCRLGNVGHFSLPQCVNASPVGLTGVTVNHILQRHASTGTLLPGKSAGILLKTTPRQDHAFFTLRWCHNGRYSVSIHQPHDCLLNSLFRRRSKKTSMLRVTGLCAGNSPGTGEFPAQMASNAENVSIRWRHHEDGPTRSLHKWSSLEGCILVIIPCNITWKIIP